MSDTVVNGDNDHTLEEAGRDAAERLQSHNHEFVYDLKDCDDDCLSFKATAKQNCNNKRSEKKRRPRMFSFKGNRANSDKKFSSIE